MDTIIVTGRLKAEEYNRDGGGFKNAGRKNAYECDGCGYYIITIDRDPGVTPFMKRCENCQGMAYSKMYRVQDRLEPTHEWYRPASLAGVPTSAYDHIEKGGLLLRSIDGKGWQPPMEAKAKEDLYAEAVALKRMHDDAASNALKVESITRQQRRHQARKGKPAPVEIWMYGAKYRRVDS